jgi:hypothetical protein
MSGTCAITQELQKRGTPESIFETTIYQGGAHEVHDPAGIDKAAAVFAAKFITGTTSIVNEHDPRHEPCTSFVAYSLDACRSLQATTIDQLRSMPNGVYILMCHTTRSVVLVHEQMIYQVR